MPRTLRPAPGTTAPTPRCPPLSPGRRGNAPGETGTPPQPPAVKTPGVETRTEDRVQPPRGTEAARNLRPMDAERSEAR